MSDNSPIIVRRVLELYAYTYMNSSDLYLSQIMTDIEHQLMWGDKLSEIANLENHCREHNIKIECIRFPDRMNLNITLII